MPIYLEPIEPDEDDDTPATVAEAIEENAKGPKSVFVDGERVEQHSISDQIKADQYASAKNVRGWPLTHRKITAPSAV